MRRDQERRHQHRRKEQESARRQVAAACQAVQTSGVPVVHVTRPLGLSVRTVRRWRQPGNSSGFGRRGRPPRYASREDRNRVYRFLKERGATTPLAAVRAEFPELRRADLLDLARRFRHVTRRRAQLRQSRLQWRRPGTVWAADFKERREPLEGRYGWILSIKDLGSSFQLAWEPLVDATAAAVQDIYTRLFAEHGPPLVLKSDNGGQFKADQTKELLAQWSVLPLYSPKRRPQYNGGVERANGQLAGYQEAVAQFYNRPAGPTCDDAERARLVANELSHPRGWQGPTADQLWDGRTPIAPQERAEFLASVEEGRCDARAHWNFAPDAALTHYQAAAVDRRAIRDALVKHDLLIIHPRRQRGRAQARHTSPPMQAQQSTTAGLPGQPPAAELDHESLASMHEYAGAGTIETAQREMTPPTVGGAVDLRQRVLALVRYLFRGGPFLR